MSFWRDYIKPLGNQDGHGKYTINEIADKLRQKGIPLKYISSNLADDYKISISTTFLSFFEAGTLIEFVFYGYFSKVKFGGRTYKHLSQAQTTKQWSSSFTFLATPGDLSLNWRELNLCWEPAQEVTSLFLKNEDYFLKTAFTINSASSGYSTTGVNTIGLIPSDAATDGLNDAGITDLHKKTAAYLVDKKYNINGLAPDNAQPSDNSFSYKTNGAECFGFIQEPEIIADNWDSTDDFVMPSELAENEAIVAYVQESIDYSDCSFTDIDPSSFCSWRDLGWKHNADNWELKFSGDSRVQNCTSKLKNFKIYNLSDVHFSEQSSFSQIKDNCTSAREVEKNTIEYNKYHSIIEDKSNICELGLSFKSFSSNFKVQPLGGSNIIFENIICNLSRMKMNISLSGETINRAQVPSSWYNLVYNNEDSLEGTAGGGSWPRPTPVPTELWYYTSYVLHNSFFYFNMPPGTLSGFLPFFHTESSPQFVGLVAQRDLSTLSSIKFYIDPVKDGNWSPITKWQYDNLSESTFPPNTYNYCFALSIGAALSSIDIDSLTPSQREELTPEDLFEKTYHIVVVHFKNTHKQI